MVHETESHINVLKFTIVKYTTHYYKKEKRIRSNPEYVWVTAINCDLLFRHSFCHVVNRTAHS